MAAHRRIGRAWIVLAASILASLLAPRAAGAAEEEFPADWFWGDPAVRAKHQELYGKPMPALTLSDWRGGEVKPEDLEGKVVVVDFWATWCGPCIGSIPHNNALYAKYRDEGLVLIGVCGSKNGQERMNEVADQHDIRYPTAKDATRASADAWRVSFWPTYGVVDRKGNVRALGLQPEHVEAVVKKLLKEGDPQPAAAAAAAAGDASAGTAAVVPVLAADDDGAVKPEWREGSGAGRAALDAMEGKEPPPLTLVNWTNGQEVSLADLKGKVVLLDFWATWCGPCIAAIPHTNELQAKYKDQGLVVLGVCHSRGAEKMAEVAKEKGIQYLIAADVDGKTVEAYQVNSFPDYYFIDRAGKLRIADCRNDSVDAAIEALLKEPAAAAAARASAAP